MNWVRFLVGAAAGATVAVLFTTDLLVKLVLWILRVLGAQEISDEKAQQIDAILNPEGEDAKGTQKG